MKYCLAIQLAGLRQLREAMGELATDLAMQRLSQQLPQQLQTILEHRCIRLMSHYSDRKQGRMRICFVYEQDNDLLSDPDFVQQMLLAAETGLLAVAVDVFGYATARLADLQVVLVPLELAADGLQVEEAFAERYRQECSLDNLAVQQLLELVRGSGPRVFLQPIVDLRRPEAPVIGYEALARGPTGTEIERADQLFETARRCGLTAELEKSCLRAALAWQDSMPSGQILSVNSSASLLLDDEVQKLLGRPQLWVELTEHLPIGQARELEPVLQQLVGHGASIALDDTGCGYADLQTAKELRPDVVKLCITVIRALEQSTGVVQELRNTVQQLHELGCLVLAEGVETAEQAVLMQELGIDYAQGWHFGRPQPAEQALA